VTRWWTDAYETWSGVLPSDAKKMVDKYKGKFYHAFLKQVVDKKMTDWYFMFITATHQDDNIKRVIAQYKLEPYIVYTTEKMFCNVNHDTKNPRLRPYIFKFPSDYQPHIPEGMSV
jgi:hypothetical protein